MADCPGLCPAPHILALCCLESYLAFPQILQEEYISELIHGLAHNFKILYMNLKRVGFLQLLNAESIYDR